MAIETVVLFSIVCILVAAVIVLVQRNKEKTKENLAFIEEAARVKKENDNKSEFIVNVIGRMQDRIDNAASLKFADVLRKEFCEVANIKTWDMSTHSSYSNGKIIGRTVVADLERPYLEALMAELDEMSHGLDDTYEAAVDLSEKLYIK